MHDVCNLNMPNNAGIHSPSYHCMCWDDLVPCAQENKRLSEPLTKALKEVEALRHSVANYDKDKMSLAQTKVGEVMLVLVVEGLLCQRVMATLKQEGSCLSCCLP